MSKNSRVLVTGAMGNVGGEVAEALLARGVKVRVSDRRLERLEARFLGRAELAEVDFRERATWGGALDGARALFLVRPPAIADVEQTLNPFLDLAKERGVEHVVFLSVAGAEKNGWVPHRKVEEHLAHIDLSHTNLRPGFFAQNLATAYRQDIVEDDRIYVPAGRSPVNWIDVRDIAEVAALILDEPTAHQDRAYTLTGPNAVRWEVVTGALTAATGRSIRYEPASLLGYARHLRRRGLERGAIAIQTLLHFLLRFGQGAGHDPTLYALLGREGRTITRYIEDHASLWAREEETRGR